MPRIARGLSDRSIYHVINRGNGRQEVFHKEKDYEVFVDLMREARDRFAVQILAYCVMPNHFHIALAPEKGEYLSAGMQWLMTSHVRKYHRHYQTSGHVWQGRYKSFIVQEDSHLMMVLRYIEANPVRAGIVKSAGDWRWSSHRENAGTEARVMTAQLPVDIPKDWTKYVDQPLVDCELARLRESLHRQAPYGDQEWQRRICEALGLGSTIRPRGRPRSDTQNEKK